ncbi:MAG: DUF58 domain-containing protein [Pseudomonadota bacterium]|jgi:uncharacterized protein (DUF58 family)|nr:DUF58 domain-containing protein [Pseudomonadota bacterium]
MNLSGRGLRSAALILLIGIAEQWAGGPGLWSVLAAIWFVLWALDGAYSHRLSLTSRLDQASAPRLGRSWQPRVELHAVHGKARAARIYLPTPSLFSGRDVRLEWEHLDRPALVQADWTPTQLGHWAWPSLQLRVLGPLGLGWWRRKLPAPGEAQAVRPDTGRVQSAEAGAARYGLEAAIAAGPGAEPYGLRDYRAGDALRNIAWRASARRDRWLTREYADEQQLQLMLVIDAGRAGRQQIGELMRLHHAVNAAARIAERAVALGDRVGLLVYDPQGLRVRQAPLAGLAALRRIQGSLTQLDSAATEADPIPAALALRRLCRQRTLILWFTDIDSGASASPLSDAVSLLVPRHLPLFAGFEDSALETLAQRKPSRWQDPYIRLAAVQAQHAARLQRASLRHHGCEVVSAAPTEIDARLLARYRELRSMRRI